MRFLSDEKRQELLVKTAASLGRLPKVGIKNSFGLSKRIKKSNLSYLA